MTEAENRTVSESPTRELMGFPPAVYLIGAQKAGTTFLANLLDQHPRILLAKPKEPHYLTQHRHRNLTWYRQCFPGGRDERILVDASPSYTAAPLAADGGLNQATDNPYAGVPERLFALAPHARFLYLVRDPVDRLYSGYWHAVRTGTEHRDFKDAIAGDSHYRRVSDYLAQLELYWQFFPRDRFLLLRFEDLRHAPLTGANQCFEFLGLERLDSVDTGSGRNRSFLYNGPARILDRTLAPVGGLAALARAGRNVLPASLQQWGESVLTSRVPALAISDREALTEEFRPMAERFRSRTGVCLYPWAGHDEA